MKKKKNFNFLENISTIIVSCLALVVSDWFFATVWRENTNNLAIIIGHKAPQSYTNHKAQPRRRSIINKSNVMEKKIPVEHILSMHTACFFSIT